MLKKKLIHCSQKVSRDAVRRETINGVEHVIVSSYTLPDDVVMNGGLYPAEAIKSSYETLERTLAPVEHPTDASGNFISAADPEAINNFYAGAYNKNVVRENGRVRVDKVINVQEALKSDRGRRLLDRVEELETNPEARPIHTSTGIFLEAEDLDEPRTNAAGVKYYWIAHNMVFDHDAILLDSIGAATPGQGVGMGVNAKGDRLDVETVQLPAYTVNTVRAATNLPLANSGTSFDAIEADKRLRVKVGAKDAPTANYGQFTLWHDKTSEGFDAHKMPFVDVVNGEVKAIPSALIKHSAEIDQVNGLADSEKSLIKTIISGYLDQIEVNADGVSFTQVLEQLQHEARRLLPTLEVVYVEDVVGTQVIISTEQGYFEAEWRLDGESAQIVGLPVSVDRLVTYQPKTNSEKGEAMKDLILNALKDAGIQTEGMDDDSLLSAYTKLNSSSDSDDTGATNESVADVVANAVKPLLDEVNSLKTQLTANAEAECEKLADVVVNSGKFAGLDKEAALALPEATLKSMAANCQVAHGIPMHVNAGEGRKSNVPTAMPE